MYDQHNTGGSLSSVPEIITMKNIAVFLDRDGNINKDVGYPNSYEQIEIYPYSFDAVKKINTAGFLAVIITNQSGIGRGLIEEKKLHEIHQKMQVEFAEHNARIDGIYYCPHHTESIVPKYRKSCTCRKPAPGMALKAAADLNIETSQSYMIGDKVADIQFGINIEATPILVLTGYGEKSLRQIKDQKIEPGPAFIATTLIEAVEWILSREKLNLSK